MKMEKNSQAGELAGASPSPQPDLRRRILVVDDDRDICRLNTVVLAGSGYHVNSAEDGSAAWDELQLNNYDLVITDHDMPKVSGIELLQKLHTAQLDVPVIMATGALPQEQLDRHPWLQIKAVLLKPYTFNQLLETVKNVLHAHTSNREEIAPPPNWQGQPSMNGLQL